MMNFRKRTSSFHGLSWQQRKQYKSNMEKSFERLSHALSHVSTVKISFQLKLPLRS